MFLMIPSHVALNWDYVFHRGLDTLVGCIVGILVGLLFWPRSTYQELSRADAGLRARLQGQLQHYNDWLGEGGARPLPLDPAPLSSGLQRLEQLVSSERGGPRRRHLGRSGWEQRLRLWQLTHFHWIAWERLMAALPEQPCREALLLRQSVQALVNQLSGDPRPTPRRDPLIWQQLAQRQQLPLLPLLALAEELRPLHACLGALNRLALR
jgi:uncharacterized membrane protein YccC